MELPFVGRQREMRMLDTFRAITGAGLLILYGRRRIGKTRLLEHWEETRFQTTAPGQMLSWTATTQSAAYQLPDFTRKAQAVDPRMSGRALPLQLDNWEDAFNYIGDLAELHAAGGPFVCILDEFTFLIQSDEAISSLLQRAWDRRLSRIRNLRLILSGSLVGVMQKKVLSAQAPMYGRATQVLRLRPLEFGTLYEIFPKWSAAERVATFAVCGGIPAYLNLFVKARGFSDGLKNFALAPQSPFFSDASMLINERLEESHVYESVLGAVSSGFHEWSDISKMARIDDKKISYYLDMLIALEYIRRDQPVTSAGAGGRRGRYYVNDPFLRFYYRFVVPNRMALNRGLIGRTVETIVDDLRSFIGTYVFEDLCRDWVLVESESGRLGWQPEEYGAYWRRGKGAVQLDVVASSRRAKRILIGEAKWTETPMGREVVTSLVERSKRLLSDLVEGEKSFAVEYALFARSGFTDAARAEAKRINARCVDLPMIEAAHIELVNMGR
jgi:uncharacterized protein